MPTSRSTTATPTRWNRPTCRCRADGGTGAESGDSGMTVTDVLALFSPEAGAARSQPAGNGSDAGQTVRGGWGSNRRPADYEKHARWQHAPDRQRRLAWMPGAHKALGMSRQRSTPRSTPGGPPRAITVTQRKRTGMEPPGGLPASPPSCVATAVGPCQLVLSAWEAGDTGLQCGLSCGGKRPRLTTRDRSSPGLMARGRGAAWRWPCPAPPTWSTPSPRTPPIPARRPSPWTAWPTRTWRRSTTIRP
jgi:hypothetical protein